MLRMDTNEWACSLRCFAKSEVWLFVLNAFLCSLNLTWKLLPVWPTYVLLQSGNFSLYTPDCVYMFGTCRLYFSNLWIALLVRNAIFKFIFLNRFVTKFVSFPMQVNVTHLCVGVCVVVAIFLCSSLVGGFGVGGLCSWIGKTLLYMMFQIMFSSVLYSSSCKLYVFSLL